jgi:hypothetical protein
VFSNFSFAQKLVKTDQFILDPSIGGFEEQILSQYIEGIGLINLGKNKAETKGWNSYILELRKPDLETVWKTSLKVSLQENFLQMKVDKSRIALVSVLHNEKQKHSQLQVTFISLDDGSLLQEKILSEHDILPWQEDYDKGGVKQTFEWIILSGNARFTTPLEYRYNLSFSPDNQKSIAYRYDFSLPDLYAEAIIFDDQWQEEKRVTLPIDKGYLNSGIFINNTGKLFLLNSKEDGTVAVIQYDPIDKSSSFLEISPSNSLRNSFNFSFEDDNHILVSNLSYRNSQLSGLMFSKFNFEEKKIDWVKFQEISPTSQINDSLPFSSLQFTNKNFELVEVYKHSGSYTVIIENRDYFAAGNAFNYFGRDHIDFWKPRKGKILTGDLLILNFNSDQDLKWVKVVNKNQENASDEGISTSSIKSEIFEQELQILYAVGVGMATQLNLVRINIQSGHLNIFELPNQNNLVLVRNYTNWLDQKTLILAGKIKFKGKASLIIKYKL